MMIITGGKTRMCAQTKCRDKNIDCSITCEGSVIYDCSLPIVQVLAVVLYCMQNTTKHSDSSVRSGTLSMATSWILLPLKPLLHCTCLPYSSLLIYLSHLKRAFHSVVCSSLAVVVRDIHVLKYKAFLVQSEVEVCPSFVVGAPVLLQQFK